MKLSWAKRTQVVTAIASHDHWQNGSIKKLRVAEVKNLVELELRLQKFSHRGTRLDRQKAI